jgi:hypothetical protein
VGAKEADIKHRILFVVLEEFPTPLLIQKPSLLFRVYLIAIPSADILSSIVFQAVEQSRPLILSILGF